MRIALDFHDVLADLKTPVVKRLNEQHGLSMTTESLTKWKCWEGAAFSKADFYAAVNASKNAGLAPLPGALDALQRLSAKRDVSILSGTRDPEGIRAWLQRHDAPELPVYAVVAPELSRAKLALGFDLYIDDNPGMVTGRTAAGPRVLLFDQPWNRALPLWRWGESRVTGWDHAMTLLEAMLG